MFWSYLEVPDDLGDAKKKKNPPLKICMWIEDRDSISFIFVRERKNSKIDNWIQEDDLRYLLLNLSKTDMLNSFHFQRVENRQLWRCGILYLSPTWKRTLE